jgi:hypothetical protein
MTKHNVFYEWDAEEWDSEGESADIINHHFGETLAEVREYVKGQKGIIRYVLVRDVGNDTDGLIDRTWAYLSLEGKLPINFADSLGNETSCAVPKRFHVEARGCK